MRTINEATPAVLRLIEILGIKVIDFTAAKSLTAISEEWQMFSGGFYDCTQDFIAFNTITSPRFNDLDVTLLHEIGHWSGAKERLNRYTVVAFGQGLAHLVSHAEVHTEELIAELTMYKLAMILRLNESKYRALKERYILQFPLGDIIEAEKQSDTAAGYVLDLMQRKRAA